VRGLIPRAQFSMVAMVRIRSSTRSLPLAVAAAAELGSQAVRGHRAVGLAMTRLQRRVPQLRATVVVMGCRLRAARLLAVAAVQEAVGAKVKRTAVHHKMPSEA